MLHPRLAYRLSDRSISFNGSTSNYGYGALSSWHNSDVPTTFLALIRPTGSGGGGFGYIISKTLASSSTGMRWFVDHNGGSPKASLGYASGSGAPLRSGPSGSITYGRWIWVAATYATGLAASNIKLLQGEQFVREVASYSTSTDGTGSFSDDATYGLHVGNRDGADRAFAGDIALVARWNAVLTNDEINDAIRLGPASYRRERQLLCWIAGVDAGPSAIRTTTLAGKSFGRSIKYRTHRQADYNWPFLPGGGGAQIVSPGGIASEEAFGTTTVSPGAVTVTASGIATAEVFGDTVVSQGGVSLICTGIASEEAFGSHTLIPGAVTVSCSGIATAEAFGSHTVVPGAVSVVCSGIATSEAFGSHTVVPGVVAVICSGIATAEAFGDAFISAGGSLVSPTGITSLEAFGSHTITTGAVSILCSGIASLEGFGAPVISVAGQFVSPNGIASAETFGTHTLSVGGVTIICGGISSLEAFGSSVITGGAVTFYTPGATWYVREQKTFAPKERRTWARH